MILANATILAVNAPGTPDRSGLRTEDGDEIWTGSLDCYLRLASRMETVNGNMNRREFEEVVIQGTLPMPIEIGSQLRGSVLTVRDRRRMTPLTRKYRAVGIREIAAGLSVDSVHIELAEQREA